MVGLLSAYLRRPDNPKQRDATTMVAAFGTLLLGLLAGAGQPALAIAGAALATRVGAGAWAAGAGAGAAASFGGSGVPISRPINGS